MDKNTIASLRVLTRPPQPVKNVMEAFLLLIYQPEVMRVTSIYISTMFKQEVAIIAEIRGGGSSLIRMKHERKLFSDYIYIDFRNKTNRRNA